MSQPQTNEPRPALPVRALRRLVREIDRVRYERVRPELSAADVSARLAPEHRRDFTDVGAFRELLAVHARSTPTAAWNAAPSPSPSALQRIRRGTFEVAGRDMTIGPDTDWHRDPVFGVQWPVRFVDAMPYHVPGSDLVLVWHLNKTAFLPEYAAAWRATGEPSFAARAWEVLDAWCRANPWMVGANWISPMEAGTRLVVWSRLLAGLADAPLPAEATARRVVQSILRHADFVAEHFSQWALPNNHLINEAAAVYTFYACWPELADGPERMQRAEAILVEEAGRQVLADGFSFECSVNYHLYVLDWLVVYLQACALADNAPAPAVLAAVEKMAAAAVALVSPGGRWPAIGDDSIDEFLALRPYGVRAGDADVTFRGLLTPPVARLFAGVAWAKDLLAVSAPLAHNVHLEEAGLTVSRDAESHLVFVHGPQHHHPFANGHMHADAGSFELELDGVPVLIDAGTYLYTKDANDRRYFRGARAHNAPIVDGVEPMKPGSAFDWETTATGEYLGSGSASEQAAVGCRRRISGGDGTPVEHIRTVVRAADTVLVVDRLRPGKGAMPGGATHAGVIHWHTPAAPGTALAQGNRVRLTDAARFVRVLEVFSDREVRVDVLDSPHDPLTGYSTRYGTLQHGETVRVGFEFESSVTIVTAIRDPECVVSVDDLSADAVECTVATAHRHRVARIQYDPFTVSIGGHVLVGGRNAPAPAQGDATDLDWLDDLE